MKSTIKDQRKEEIEAAAYALLAEVGYKKISMLAIAKKASVSNETLYKWYDNKQNLFASLVKKNADIVGKELIMAIDNHLDTIETLQVIGPFLLKIITSEKVIMLNRAAAIDVNECNTLGKTISEQGRMKVTPLLIAIFQQGIDENVFKNTERNQDIIDAQNIAQLYLNLLIGDIQIQRLIGTKDILKPGEILHRSNRALKCLKQLYT